MFSEKQWVFKILQRSVPALLLCLSIGTAPSRAASDVRIVIDISGSMKKNDPQNLRVPALKLVANVLPKDAQAGVWTFGQWVNNLVPVRPVTTAWQQEATAAAAQISSLGQFTNIPDALEKAAADWPLPAAAGSTGSAAGSQRHIVLLTDGVVDVAKDPAVNLAAKQRLLTQILPGLKARAVHIHTIALSRESDVALLQLLAQETGGLFELVESAEAINKVFLRIFSQATPRDALPLSDNRFQVDASIEEFTLLVFKTPASKPTRLLMPDQTVLTADKATMGLKWFADSRYDLVTVAQPPAGSWSIDADVDPDNRVLVVSDLKLQATEPASVLLPGEQISLSAQLLQDEQPITSADFLSLVKAKVVVQAGEYLQSVDMVASADGHFSAAIPAPTAAGNAAVSLHIESPTFQRSRSYAVQILAGNLTMVRKAAEDEHSQAISLSWPEELLVAEGLSIQAQLTAPDGTVSTPEFSISGAQAELTVNSLAAGDYRLQASVSAKTVQGREVVLQAETLLWTIAGAVAQTPAPEPVHAEPAKAEPASDANTDSLLWWSLIIGVNVVLAVAGGIIWWLLRRRRKAAQAAVTAALGE